MRGPNHAAKPRALDVIKMVFLKDVLDIVGVCGDVGATLGQADQPAIVARRSRRGTATRRGGPPRRMFFNRGPAGPGGTFDATACTCTVPLR